MAKGNKPSREARRLNKQRKSQPSSTKTTFFKGRVTHTKIFKDYQGNTTEKTTSYNAFGLVLAILLVVCLARLAGGLGESGLPTFRSFLNMLGNAPTIPTDWIKYVSYNLDFPWFLEWLEKGLEMLGDLVSLLTFTVAGGINALIYLLYFVRWLLW